MAIFTKWFERVLVANRKTVLVIEKVFADQPAIESFFLASLGIQSQFTQRSLKDSCVDKPVGSAPRFAYVMLLGDVSQSRDYFVFFFTL